MTTSQQPPESRLSLRLLGGFSVARSDGKPAVLPYAKLRALLACLALERGNELDRGWLAGLLWPSLDETVARQNLRRALSNLRSALRDEDGERSFFRIGRLWIGLNPSAAIDIDVAELLDMNVACEFVSDGMGAQQHCPECLARMEALAARYRGELLPGFALPDNPEFDEWLSGRRDILRRHVMQLLDRLSACHMSRGEPERALPHGLRRLDLDRWDEAALRRVMAIYVAGGQAAAALNQFHTFRRELECELGIQPDQETKRLAEEIEPSVQRPAAADSGTRGRERRQITVVCCRFDVPDDAAERIEQLPAIRHECEELLRFSGGHVAAAPGIALACFGYPRADERAPRKAVGAALSVMHAAAAAGVVARVGIHSGLVLSDVDAGEIDLSGEVSGVAMIIPQLVPRGAIAVSLPAYHLVLQHFECEALGDWPLGGDDTTLTLFRVLGRRTQQRHLQSMRNRLSPFVGREGALRCLQEAWSAALDGRRQSLLVRGEAGIGKSRLAQELLENAVANDVTVVDLSCQPESAQEALHPLLAWVHRQLDEAPGGAIDDPATRLAWLAGRLFPGKERQCAELAAWLLDPARGAASADDGRRQRMLNLLLDLAEKHATRSPLLVLIEDIHWADPSLRELIDLLRKRSAPARIFLLATARPEFDLPDAWPVLELGAMSASSVRAMVEAIAADTTLPAPAMAGIVESSDGVPLFVEEMTRMLLRGDRTYDDVPPTVRDLLSARLDALGDARSFAEHASILGRAFVFEDVAHMMALPASDAKDRVARLEGAGLISCEAGGCEFRHALIRDVAYGSLSPLRQRALHLRAAEVLREHRPHLVAQQPGLLAHHYTKAGDVAQAVRFHQAAADLAQGLSAYREMAWHLRQALGLISGRELPPALPSQVEASLLLRLGWVVGELDGFGSDEARDLYGKAQALCQSGGDDEDHFRMLLGLWRGSSSWFGYAKSLELGEQLMAMAERRGDAHQLALACYALGNVHCALGHLDCATGYLRRAVSLYRTDMPVGDYGDSAGVGAHGFLGWAETLRGNFVVGSSDAVAGVALAREIDHPPATCLALLFAAETCRLRGEVSAAVAYGSEAGHIAASCGIASWAVFAEAFIGWGLALAGDASGLPRVRLALDRVMSSIMAGTAAPLFCMTAEAALMTGDHATGLAIVADGLALMERNGGRHLQPDLLMLRARLLERAGSPDAVRDSLCEAVAIASAHGARLFELRALTALLRLPDDGACRAPVWRRRVQALLAELDQDELPASCRVFEDVAEG